MIYIFAMLVLFSVSASAEIEKFAQMCEQQICFYWWPKLPEVKGWHHEREHSYLYSANAQAPDGYTFANAEYVVYAKAIYKPRDPETKSLKMLIENGKNDFVSKDPSILITEAEPLVTGDGQIMKSYTFFSKGKGNWERVSYGEKGDFYLIFTVSSRTEQGYKVALSAYKQFVNRYKEKQ